MPVQVEPPLAVLAGVAAAALVYAAWSLDLIGGLWPTRRLTPGRYFKWYAGFIVAYLTNYLLPLFISSEQLDPPASAWGAAWFLSSLAWLGIAYAAWLRTRHLIDWCMLCSEVEPQATS